MKHRMKTNKRKDNRIFRKTALSGKTINSNPGLMRGGIRL